MVHSGFGSGKQCSEKDALLRAENNSQFYPQESLQLLPLPLAGMTAMNRTSVAMCVQNLIQNSKLYFELGDFHTSVFGLSVKPLNFRAESKILIM